MFVYNISNNQVINMDLCESFSVFFVEHLKDYGIVFKMQSKELIRFGFDTKEEAINSFMGIWDRLEVGQHTLKIKG